MARSKTRAHFLISHPETLHRLKTNLPEENSQECFNGEQKSLPPSENQEEQSHELKSTNYDASVNLIEPQKEKLAIVYNAGPLRKTAVARKSTGGIIFPKFVQQSIVNDINEVSIISVQKKPNPEMDSCNTLNHTFTTAVVPVKRKLSNDTGTKKIFLAKKSTGGFVRKHVARESTSNCQVNCLPKIDVETENYFSSLDLPLNYENQSLDLEHDASNSESIEAVPIVENVVFLDTEEKVNGFVSSSEYGTLNDKTLLCEKLDSNQVMSMNEQKDIIETTKPARSIISTLNERRSLSVIRQTLSLLKEEMCELDNDLD